MMPLFAILAAIGARSAAGQATSNTIHVKLNCATENVHVWVFNANGVMVAENDIKPGDKKEADIEEPGNRYVTAADRFLTTSTTSGCVQARTARDMGGRPINLVEMTCGQSKAIDLVLTADSKTTFDVHASVPRVVNSAMPCRWDKIDLADSTVYYFTHGQELLLVVNSNGKKARVPLDWKKAFSAKRQSLDKLCSSSRGGCALNQVDLQVPLNRIRVEMRPSK